jgi:hypothetical protein
LAILLNIPWYIFSTLFRGLSTTLLAAVRVIPALFAILVVVFITGDAWKLFGTESSWRFLALILLIGVMSITATIISFKGPEGSWRNVTGYSLEGTKLLSSWADKTPARKLKAAHVKPLLPPAPSADSQDEVNSLIRMHEKCISVLYMVTIISHVIAAAFWISCTFILIGLTAISQSMTRELSNSAPDVLVHFSIAGQSFVITRQLIQVSIVLGGIAALTFASGTLQDTEKRHIITDNALIDLKRALGALAYYYGAIMELVYDLNANGMIAKLRGQAATKRLTASFDRLEAAAKTSNGNSSKPPDDNSSESNH